MFKWLSDAISERNDNEGGCFDKVRMPVPVHETIIEILEDVRPVSEPIDIPERPVSRRA